MARQIKRRHAVQLTIAGLGGLATGHFGPTAAHAAALITDPALTPIAPSGKRVELLDFCTPPATRGSAPRALLNYLHHAGDGSNRVFANDSRGKIWEIDRTTGATRLFLDFQLWRGGAFLFKSNKQLGLRSFAFHPDFANPARPGFRRLYTVNTEFPDYPDGVPVLKDPDPDVLDYYHDVVSEWQVDAAAKVDVGTRREVLRIS